ncbi:MAG: phosphoribosylaminoimidazolesuccinocarboxamide synthase [Flavobacteriales bacterium]|nr:phosphoribosylaminoimidazolesuccinocarboxamide synthase [Flavobacteriales bacterium]MBL6868894.1 phosphoribosylaminoimidazolesuccinocarboxamide synthase [Flavobacteriales bacterium]
MRAITSTNFNFPNQKDVYNGKVRDVYNINDEFLTMIVTDRISAFDVVLPKGIPFKGQVLNQLAKMFLKSTEDIVPNWMISSPDPNVTIGHFCKPFKIEMVIRGYLTGHAWRTYKSGKREICGVEMPDGMVEHQKFPTPIITPSTKADFGHDEDISREDILRKGIVKEKDYLKLEEFTRAIFKRGSEMADERGLILVDTKYEFGKKDGKIFLIDEIHTPDSSRYFYKDGYRQRQENGEPQKQLSKEFVREWLMENGFQGKDGQKIPEMNKEFVESVSNRYIELFEKVSGTKFEKPDFKNPIERIEKNILEFFK